MKIQSNSLDLFTDICQVSFTNGARLTECSIVIAKYEQVFSDKRFTTAKYDKVEPSANLCYAI